MTILRDELGHFLPGVSGNPSGRPTLRATVTGEVISLLNINPHQVREIAQSWLDACKNRDIRALQELLDRTEGKVVEKHQLDGIIFHISEEYTDKVLKAFKENEIEREGRLLLTEGNGGFDEGGNRF